MKMARVSYMYLVEYSKIQVARDQVLRLQVQPPVLGNYEDIWESSAAVSASSLRHTIILRGCRGISCSETGSPLAARAMRCTLQPEHSRLNRVNVRAVHVRKRKVGWMSR